MSIGKLTRLPLREVWKHEATDFTVWLQDNLAVDKMILLKYSLASHVKKLRG